MRVSPPPPDQLRLLLLGIKFELFLSCPQKFSPLSFLFESGGGGGRGVLGSAFPAFIIFDCSFVCPPCQNCIRNVTSSYSSDIRNLKIQNQRGWKVSIELLPWLTVGVLIQGRMGDVFVSSTCCSWLDVKAELCFCGLCFLSRWMDDSIQLIEGASLDWLGSQDFKDSSWWKYPFGALTSTTRIFHAGIFVGSKPRCKYNLPQCINFRANQFDIFTISILLHGNWNCGTACLSFFVFSVSNASFSLFFFSRENCFQYPDSQLFSHHFA